MSVGNSKSNGNKGNNFPFQKNLLRGVQKLIDGNEADTLKLIANILSSKLKRPGRTTLGPGNVGTIPAGYLSYTITNVGSSNALLDGEPLYPGMSETYDPGLANILDEITYDTQLTTIQVITIS